MAAKREASKVPAQVERFVKALVVAAKAVNLYPSASNIPRDTAAEAAEILHGVLRERPELRLIVTKDGLRFGDEPLFPGQESYQSFAFELYTRKLADVRFHSGTEAPELISLLSLLKLTPAEIESSGGFENRLWDLGVGTITVTETRVTIVDAGTLAATEADAATAPPMERKQIDEILAAAYGGRPRDQLMIARFIGDKRAVASYLRETFHGGGLSDSLATAERFAELAQVACETGGEEGRAALLHSLAGALEDLDPEMRRQLLVDSLLPEARTDEALAAVIRQMDIDTVCHMLVDQIAEDTASRDGLARAIRNLALISMAEREEVVTAAGAAMRGAGLSESMVGEVLELAAPSRLTMRERASAAGSQERPVDAIFKLMDLAPTPTAKVDDDDSGVAAIREESRRGITDGDVVMALVSLVGIDHREQPFAATMAAIEDSLDLLVERGEIDIAADAVDALKLASENPEFSPAQRGRLAKALGKLTKPSDIKSIAHALRLYETGTVENQAARRLLDALGPLAIEPLLEQLAEEQDMSVRKSIVDLLSEIARDYIPELGAHVSDPRWFVVRNVVSILGSARTSAVLPYLERTLRHADGRVRRETIRACSGISDRIAHEMLIAALTDDEAQNVQLAARYLGAASVRGAAPALEQVARGDGRGNRDLAPRVEAIEALGRLGAVEALPALESIAGKRSIIGASRARELRAAAESAIAHIRQTQRGEGR